ncbi:hypothetical protein DUNSADRAFT_12003 [Dunaliella salina]|uniref:TNFR-Cys domain-containing protein n=1 Tax=Dunaliella salina TaxID=3046 RepID=A0ABQ7GC59_DUNSA|nr:hypothetical protein DUNSADRAFT_12003 [Dunaliella salina]|eukprot:KAF5832196.1 hypothetical protein DUNSADRAFT_12003 [Dunaliella salina]
MEKAPTLEKTQSRRTGDFRSKSRKKSSDPFGGDGDAKEETNHAQQVVRELYTRYKQQLERWRGYRDLAWIMAFSTLLLAVLYTQRQAPIAHKVFQTLEDVLVPEGDSVASTADVYGWLKGVLKDVWKDPLCGDGLCEEPFEYPSYSRYGCRADCGKLNEKMNLTTIQINVEWNFTHPANALESTSLREQSSWNLCPVGPNNGGTEILFSRKCYFGDDHTFASTTGSTSTVLRDVPDGTWEMLIRRDTFHKTKGSVMDHSKVQAIAYYYRVYIAALAAAAQQNTEVNLLEEGHRLATTPFMEYARMKIGSDTGFRDYIIATCACLGVTVEQGRDFNYSQPIPEDDDDTPLILRPFRITQVEPVNTLDDLQTKVCQRYNYTDADRPVLGDGQAWEDLEGDQFKTPYCQNLLLGSSTTIAANSRSVRWAEEQVAEVKRLLVAEREGDEDDNGVADVGQAVYDGLKEYVEENMGELYNPVFQMPRGVLALRDLARAKGQAVYEQFYMGEMLEQGEAYINLTRASVESESDLTLPDLAFRAEARIKEVQLQQDQFLNISIPKDDLFSAETLPESLKVSELIDVFSQALDLTMDSRQCQPDEGQPAYRAPCMEVQLLEGNTVVVSNTTLPEADAPALRNATFGSGNGTGTLYLPYTIVAWYGGGDAYLRDNLDRRGPQYIGECKALDVTCTRNIGSSKNPYNCTYLDSGEKVPGDMTRDPEYRLDCEIPCSEQMDCNALCECGGGGFENTGCGEHEMCECKECSDGMSPDASKDSEFFQLITRSRGGASFDAIAEVDLSERRQLGVQEEINKMLGQTETLQELQDDIQEKMASVTAAEDARKALGNIEEMASLQLQAQEALRRAVQDQVNTIQRNIDEGKITALEALVLYKRTRRDGRIESKRVNLANDPVVRRPTESYMFELRNDPFEKADRARERYVGLTNRVISGLLLHQVRVEDVECGMCDEFGKIDDSCKGEVKTEPYGVDPVFKRGTSLYNPDFDDIDSEIVASIYNCSALDDPT